MNEKVNKYLKNKKLIEELTKENEGLGNDILNYMIENNKKDYTTPSGVVSLIQESTCFRFDPKRFQEQNGIIEYNKYLKESTTKAHLTTKLTK